MLKTWCRKRKLAKALKFHLEVLKDTERIIHRDWQDSGADQLYVLWRDAQSATRKLEEIIARGDCELMGKALARLENGEFWDLDLGNRVV